MSSQRSVSLAVVFADVVGSTRLYEQLGDVAARDTVARCIDVIEKERNDEMPTKKGNDTDDG
jgi:class 3 adenylate cyclase